MNEEEMKERTKEFAKRIIRLCRALPRTLEGRLIGDQIFRAGTSVGSNYRAACRGRSKAEFTAKLGISLEEADEALFWLEIISECQILKDSERLLGPLIHECKEIIAILVASIKTSRASI